MGAQGVLSTTLVTPYSFLKMHQCLKSITEVHKVVEDDGAALDTGVPDAPGFSVQGGER